MVEWKIGEQNIHHRGPAQVGPAENRRAQGKAYTFCYFIDVTILVLLFRSLKFTR
jgi:hypothetical protein